VRNDSSLNFASQRKIDNNRLMVTEGEMIFHVFLLNDESGTRSRQNGKGHQADSENHPMRPER